MFTPAAQQERLLEGQNRHLELFFLTWRTIDLEYKYFPQNYANPDKMSLGQCYLEQILLSQMNFLVSYLCDMVKPIPDYSHFQSSNVIILFLICVKL